MATTIFTNALGTDRADSGQPSWRNVLAITGGAQSQVRVTFQAGGPGIQFVADHASIGIWSGTTMITTATPVELLFGGLSGFNITSGAGTRTITSDWVNLSGFTASDKLVVIIDNDSSGNQASTDQSGPAGSSVFVIFSEASYNKADPTADGSWGTTGIAWVYGVSLIETQAGGGGDVLQGAQQIIMM